jgi:hypothetical protein
MKSQFKSAITFTALALCLLLSRPAKTMQELENVEMAQEVDSEGNTHLHLACEQGNVQQIQKLIEDGAAIEARNNDGQTPLLTACAYGNLAAVVTLIELGATIDSKNNFGSTSLHNAIISITESSSTIQIINLLNSNGVSYQTNLTSTTPIGRIQMIKSWTFDNTMLTEYDKYIDALASIYGIEK